MTVKNGISGAYACAVLLFIMPISSGAQTLSCPSDAPLDCGNGGCCPPGDGGRTDVCCVETYQCTRDGTCPSPSGGGSSSSDTCTGGAIPTRDTCSESSCSCAAPCASSNDCKSGCCANGYCALPCTCDSGAQVEYNCDSGNSSYDSPSSGGGNGLTDSGGGGGGGGCASTGHAPLNWESLCVMAVVFATGWVNGRRRNRKTVYDDVPNV